MIEKRERKAVPARIEGKLNHLSREYPDRPIVGVGAVIVKNGCVLLVQRGTEPFKGQWSLPGGVQDLGETLEQGIIREMREETGLDVQPIEVAGVIDRILPDATGKLQYHYVLIDYVCRIIGGELLPASDAQDVRWVREEELSNYQLVIGTEEVVRKVLRKDAR
ncbi:MAG: hydrolase [Acidobacteriales bacterium]|nr:hydrolase [Terriglobales bacterium]